MLTYGRFPLVMFTGFGVLALGAWLVSTDTPPWVAWPAILLIGFGLVVAVSVIVSTALAGYADWRFEGDDDEVLAYLNRARNMPHGRGR